MKLSKSFLKFLRFPKDATHAKVTTDKGKFAVVSQRAFGTLAGVEAASLEFGAMVAAKGKSKEFAPLATQPDVKAAFAEFEALPADQRDGSKSAKPAKAPKAKKEKAAKEPREGGTLGALFGHSVTAVLRRLGKEGVTTAQAREIMKGLKVKVADATVQIQTAAGRNGDKKRGEPAELTQAQIKECMSHVPAEPAKAKD